MTFLRALILAALFFFLPSTAGYSATLIPQKCIQHFINASQEASELNLQICMETVLDKCDWEFGECGNLVARACEASILDYQAREAQKGLECLASNP